MVPLAIDNELDHNIHARSFIEKYAIARLQGRFPENRDFLTLDLSARHRTGYCFPDFVVISVGRLNGDAPKQQLIGFELKVPAGISVEAIEQAQRQRSVVNGVFLLLLLPSGFAEERRLKQMRALARTYGVGIIRVRDWRDGCKYELLEEMQISAPKQAEGPEVVKAFLSSTERAFFRKWMQA